MASFLEKLRKRKEALEKGAEATEKDVEAIRKAAQEFRGDDRPAEEVDKGSKLYKKRYKR